MSAKIEIHCPRCGAKTEMAYVLVGTRVPCPSCGEEFVVHIPVGSAAPRTHYEITFADFRQLLDSPQYRRPAAALLGEWYGYRVVREGASFVVKDRNGATVDLIDLHLRIQGDPSKQGELYQVAMALWR